MWKTILLAAILMVLCTILFAQSPSAPIVVSISATGTGQTITGSVTIPLAPSSLVAICNPSAVQKGGSVGCTVTLDQPVQPGATLTAIVSLGPTPPAGVSVSPGTITIAAGSASCGTAAVPCFTVSRQ